MNNFYQLLGIRRLVSFIAKHHELVIAGADAQSKRESFESQAGCTLPSDLREFYEECESTEIGNVEILPITKVRAVQAIYGESMSEQFSPMWFAFASLHDSSFVAFDAGLHQDTNRILYIDPYAHMGEQLVIAASFSHFLSNLLIADGDLFWFDPSFYSETANFNQST